MHIAYREQDHAGKCVKMRRQMDLFSSDVEAVGFKGIEFGHPVVFSL